jgi:hypothetical protein
VAKIVGIVGGSRLGIRLESGMGLVLKTGTEGARGVAQVIRVTD